MEVKCWRDGVLTLQMLEAQDLLKGLNVECMEVFVSLFCIFFGLRHWKGHWGKTWACPGLGEKSLEFTFRHLRFE